MIRQHSMKFHVAAAAQCTRIGKAHAAMAASHRGLAEQCEENVMEDAYKLRKETSRQHHRDLANEHSAASDVYADAAQENLTLCRALQASGAGDDIETLRPSRDVETHADARLKAAGNPWINPPVHGVLPDNPVRLIPRPGGPQVEVDDSTEAIDKLAKT